MISKIQPHLFLTATAWRSWRLYQNEKEWQQFIKGPAGKEAWLKTTNPVRQPAVGVVVLNKHL